MVRPYLELESRDPVMILPYNYIWFYGLIAEYLEDIKK